jgi:hypothetical protein
MVSLVANNKFMKGFTIFVVLAAAVIIGFLVMRKPVNQTPAIEETSDISLSNISTKDESVNGTKELNTTSSEAKWTGSKKLIKEYFDNGTIAIKGGNAVFSRGVLTGGEVVFDMTTITATSTGKGDGEDMLSGHLKSADFFDVEKWNEAKFKITSVALEAGDTYMLTGDLTIKDKTNSVTFPAEVVTSNGLVTITGTATIDRSLYDVKFGSEKFFSDLGDKVINDEFTLSFSVTTK